MQEEVRRNHQRSSASTAEPTYYIVKLHYPIKAGLKQDIAHLSKDNSLLYLPHDAYIASMLPSAAEKTSKLDGVIDVYYLPSGQFQVLAGDFASKCNFAEHTPIGALVIEDVI